MEWYRRNGAKFIQKTIGMTLEEKGAYSLCLDLIYTHDGAIDDDEKFLAGVCGVTTRKWRALRQRLIDLGKLVLRDGKLTNERADQEFAEISAKAGRKAVENSSETDRKLVENSSKTPRKQCENEMLSLNNNDLTPTDIDIDIDIDKKIEDKDKKDADAATRAREDFSKPETEPEKPTVDPATEFIRAFDTERQRVFGEPRPWPHPKDIVSARRWREGGLVLSDANQLFASIFERMKAQGRSPPSGLAYFERPVCEILAELKKPLEIKAKNATATNPPRKSGNGFVELYLQRFGGSPPVAH